MFGRSWFARHGYYGFDILSFVLLLAALLSVQWWWRRYVWPIAVVLVLLAVYRVFSKDFDRRRREQMAAYQLILRIGRGFSAFGDRVGRAVQAVSRRFAFWGERWRSRKTYRYLRCPGCKGMLRLPRHKGKLVATCPVCGREFRART